MLVYVSLLLQTEANKRNTNPRKTLGNKRVPVELVGNGERSGGLPRARQAVEQHVQQLQGARLN